jgi:hypothetical protein
MKINNIDFVIKNIDIQNNNPPWMSTMPTKMLSQVLNQVPLSKTIKIIAETSNSNYMLVESWFNTMLSYAKDYKKDFINHTIEIYGICPINYTFNQNGIEVTLSADYIKGDIYLFKQQQLRKAKLKKLEKIK